MSRWLLPLTVKNILAILRLTVNFLSITLQLTYCQKLAQSILRGALGSLRNRKTAKKFDQNRKPHVKPSKPINLHISVVKILIDMKLWLQVEQHRCRGYSRSAEACNCCSNRRETGSPIWKIEKAHQIANLSTRQNFWRKPKTKCWKRKIHRTQRTTKPKNRRLLAQKPKTRSKKRPKPQTPMPPSWKVNLINCFVLKQICSLAFTIRVEQRRSSKVLLCW